MDLARSSATEDRSWIQTIVFPLPFASRRERPHTERRLAIPGPIERQPACQGDCQFSGARVGLLPANHRTRKNTRSQDEAQLKKIRFFHVFLSFSRSTMAVDAPGFFHRPMKILEVPVKTFHTMS